MPTHSIKEKPGSTLTPENKTIILRVGTGDTGSDLNPHLMIGQQYELLHPDVFVQLDTIAGTDYYSRIMTLSKAGKAPDIMLIGDDYIEYFVDRGLFSPITGMTGESSSLSEDYLPGLLES